MVMKNNFNESQELLFDDKGNFSGLFLYVDFSVVINHF